MSDRGALSSSSSSARQSNELASGRWELLRHFVLSCGENRDYKKQPELKVTSFSSFRLFTVTQLFPDKVLSRHSTKDRLKCCDEPRPSDATEKWFHYKASINRSNQGKSTITAELIVKHISEKPSLETLIGFNNTGNVCVWPSEEVMAFYCLKHFEMFQGANVCELGGGMTSLSGLFLGSTRVPSKVLLTDGNQKSVDNIREIISANVCLAGVNVSSQLILWDQSFLSQPSVHDSTFDYILCADCLFFTEVHTQLVQVIFKLLRFHGEALIFAPKRSGTLEQFCDVASQYFDLETDTKYDDIIWYEHEKAVHKLDGIYKMDIHYPIMILLKKSCK